MIYELSKTYCSDNCDYYEPEQVEKLKVGDYEELIKEAKDLITKDLDDIYDDFYIEKPKCEEYTREGYYKIFFADSYIEHGYRITKETNHKIGEEWLEGVCEDY